MCFVWMKKLYSVITMLLLLTVTILVFSSCQESSQGEVDVVYRSIALPEFEDYKHFLNDPYGEDFLDPEDRLPANFVEWEMLSCLGEYVFLGIGIAFQPEDYYYDLREDSGFLLTVHIIHFEEEVEDIDGYRRQVSPYTGKIKILYPNTPVYSNTAGAEGMIHRPEFTSKVASLHKVHYRYDEQGFLSDVSFVMDGKLITISPGYDFERVGEEDAQHRFRDYDLQKDTIMSRLLRGEDVWGELKEIFTAP